MKLHLTSLIIILTTVISVFGQPGKMEIGIATGLNISSSHGMNYEQYFDWRYTQITSIQTTYSLTPNLSAVAGVNHESKGCKGTNMKLLGIEKNSLGSNHTFDYALEYITVPLLLKYTGTRFPFFVNAGAYYGQLLSYTETYDILTINRIADMKQEDYGFCLGLGTTFSLSENLSISLEVRENLGLVNIKNSDASYNNAFARPVNDLNPMFNNAINIFFGFNCKL